MKELVQKVVARCPNCGGDLVGDGYASVRRCEFAEVPEGAEPDAGPVYCGYSDAVAAASPEFNAPALTPAERAVIGPLEREFHKAKFAVFEYADGYCKSPIAYVKTLGFLCYNHEMWNPDAPNQQLFVKCHEAFKALGGSGGLLD